MSDGSGGFVKLHIGGGVPSEAEAAAAAGWIVLPEECLFDCKLLNSSLFRYMPSTS